jgi:intergrase/recombinase
MTLSPRNKHHAMTALANLAKYTGCYDLWLQIRQCYNLKWTSGNESLQSFNRFFDDELNLDVMLQRIKDMMRLLPPNMAQIIKFAWLIGLRPAEVVESVKLINDEEELQEYYKPERQALEHFRFPDIFLRQTKKAYISFVTPEMLDMVRYPKSSILTYNAIRLTCRRKGINMEMRFCRKVFASWFHKCSISDITIDLLQGRVGQSVLVNHYIKPSRDYKDKIIQALNELKKELDLR